MLRHKNHDPDGSEKLSNAERIVNSALDQIQVKVDIMYTLKYHYYINFSSLHILRPSEFVNATLQF